MAGKQGRLDQDDMENPSHLIDERIRSLGDWRGELLARARELQQAMASAMAAAQELTELMEKGQGDDNQ